MMPTNMESILWPVIALVTLTSLSWLRMYQVRIGVALRERIDPQDVNRFNPDLPRSIATSGDNFGNLCELPLLFYALTILLYVTGLVDGTLVMLAWTYVALRVAHTVIHTTYNRVIHRFWVYVLSSLVLWVMWAQFAYKLWLE